VGAALAATEAKAKVLRIVGAALAATEAKAKVLRIVGAALAATEAKAKVLRIVGAALAATIFTRPHSLASFFSAMARCAALYLQKKRSHALGPTTHIV